MEKHIRLADIDIGDKVRGYYILQDASVRSSGAKTFLTAAFSDASDVMDAVMWDYRGPVDERDLGCVLWISGTVSEHRGNLQIVLDQIRFTDDRDTIHLPDLVPSAPIDPDAWYQEMEDMAASVKDKDYAAIAKVMLERHGQEIKEIPAGKSVHHEFLYGLLMHTVNMMRAADFFAKLYPDTLDRDLLLTGTLLHDMAKGREFQISDLGLVAGYTVPGDLLGHLVMGAQEVADVARELNVPEDKSILLQHLLLSHHGEPEHGAAVIPVTAESELLAYLDKIDSRMEIYRKAILDTPEGSFSERIFALDKHVYHHA